MTTNKKIRIITTAGTSIINNFLDVPSNSTHKSKIKELQEDKNTKQKVYFSEQTWKTHCENWSREGSLKNKIVSFGKTTKEKSCAELQSIAQIAKGYQEVEVILLSSYTLDGYLAATIIKELLKGGILGFKPNVILEKPIEGLVVDNADEFESKGFHNLVSLLKKYSTESIKDSDVVFNVSGGFKAVIPIITLITQIQGLPLKYIYEDSNKVITLGNLPISFDGYVIDSLIHALDNNLLNNTSNEIDSDILKLLWEYKLIKKIINSETQNEEIQISEMGELLRGYVNDSGNTLSEDILGLFVEYKIYEYFNEIKFEGGNYKVKKTTIYEKDGELNDVGNGQQKAEIDLILEYEDRVVLGESKSYQKTKRGLKNEFEKKSNAYEELYKRAVDNFYLFISVPKFYASSNSVKWYEDPSNDKIKALKDLKLEISTLRCFYLELDLSKNQIKKGNAKINFKALLQKKITPIEITNFIETNQNTNV